MKKLVILVLCGILGFAFSSAVFAADGDCGHPCNKAVAEDEEQSAPMVFDEPQPVGAKATCPVTGNEFTITEKTESSEYKGKYVYFCCPGCKPQFDADPEKYLKGKKK